MTRSLFKCRSSPSPTNECAFSDESLGNLTLLFNKLVSSADEKAVRCFRFDLLPTSDATRGLAGDADEEEDKGAWWNRAEIELDFSWFTWLKMCWSKVILSAKNADSTLNLGKRRTSSLSNKSLPGKWWLFAFSSDKKSNVEVLASSLTPSSGFIDDENFCAATIRLHKALVTLSSPPDAWILLLLFVLMGSFPEIDAPAVSASATATGGEEEFEEQVYECEHPSVISFASSVDPTLNR